MQKLTGENFESAKYFMLDAKEQALKSTCQRSRCGSVVVSKGGTVIGRGLNSPPGGLESQRRCLCDKSSYNPKVTDKTCCIHAEQRAIIDSLSSFFPSKQLFFVRLDDTGEIKRSGKPYCTICSKLALDVGIKEFCLWHEDGIYAYNTEEYNRLSYEYEKQK